MIEDGRGPVRRTVADFTLLRETASDVVRVICPLVILQVATDAGSGTQVVVAVRVALPALHLYVSSRKRETRF